MNGTACSLAGTLLVATIAIATDSGNLLPEARKIMAPPLPQAAALFKSTKTICFGRLLIDVPVTATVVYGPASVPVPTVFIPGGAKDIDQHVERSMAELEKDRMFLDPKGEPLPLFGTAANGAAPGQRLVFGSKDLGSYTIHSYATAGPDLYLQYINVVTRYDDAIRSLGDFARKVRPRAIDEIPAGPGFCIEGGFVPGEDTHEEVSLGIRLAEYPDVHFSVSTHKNGRDVDLTDNLETHMARGTKEWPAWSARIKYLRQGARQLGPWKGFEALGRIPPQRDGKEVHEFHFISVGLAEDSLRPRLDVQMDTGASENKAAALKPSVNDEEALLLWDRLLGSMRLRPSAPLSAAASDDETSIENMQRSGAVCSQTGWWQCADEGNIAGGRQRYFKTGQVLPMVILEDEATFWQKLNGKKNQHQLETVWRFLDKPPV